MGFLPTPRGNQYPHIDQTTQLNNSHSHRRLPWRAVHLGIVLIHEVDIPQTNRRAFKELYIQQYAKTKLVIREMMKLW